jgi:hypothetical protein
VKSPLPNSYWVLPGRLLAGEHPSGGLETGIFTRIATLSQVGIDCYVDLTEEGEQPDYRSMLPSGAEYLRSAIVDMHVPFNVSQTQMILASIRAALARQRRIYLHCRAGIGRTGLIVGCFLAEEENSGRKALKALNDLWQQSERARSWPRVPQTLEQTDYVRRWPKLRGKFSFAG